MIVLDAIAADWWHSATVAVLAFALALEASAAFCRQAGVLTVERSSGGSLSWWERIWVGRMHASSRMLREDQPPRYVPRFPRLKPELGTLLRGVSRLTIAALFLARIAAKQPALPLVDLGM
ncbi:MAG: hypothetical protein F4020_00770 [Gammaproteobacteria bacterium]|nr:hypothetical protein [Chloroflexota bacterium]MYK68136.1 hypothetical protein [Gammaproteobacteria bacterium]